MTARDIVETIMDQETIMGHIRGKRCEIIIATLQKKPHSVFISIIKEGTKEPVPTNIDDVRFSSDNDENSSIRALLKYEALKKKREQK